MDGKSTQGREPMEIRTIYTNQDDPDFQKNRKSPWDHKQNRRFYEESFGQYELAEAHLQESRIQTLRDRILQGTTDEPDANMAIARMDAVKEQDIKTRFAILLQEGAGIQFFQGRSDKAVNWMILDALHDPNIQTSWALNTRVEKVPTTLMEFRMAYEDGKVPFPVLMAILEKRKSRQESLKQEYQERFDCWRGEFLERFQQAQDNGIIPADPALARRLQQVEIRIADPLSDSFYSVTNTSHPEQRVQISVENGYGERLTDEHIRRNLFHELIHQSSGYLIRDDQEWRRDAGEEKELIGHQYHDKKVGLRFGQTSWLNEGMTELLTTYLLQLENNPEASFGIMDHSLKEKNYSYEQEAILELVKIGVPLSLFLKAYFEGPAFSDQAPTKEASRLPGFLELNRSVMEAYRRLPGRGSGKPRGQGWLKNIQQRIDRRYDTQSINPLTWITDRLQTTRFVH